MEGVSHKNMIEREGDCPTVLYSRVYQLLLRSIIIMHMRFSSLTTSLGKKLVLPTFRLDALVFLRGNGGLEHLCIGKISFLPSEAVKEEKLSSCHVCRSNCEISTFACENVAVSTCGDVGSKLEVGRPWVCQ